MARMRSLKPEFWDDEELAAATSRDARMLYMGLWNLADEHSRLRGDPRYIKGKLFAYDDDLSAPVIEKLLESLAGAGRVVRYRVAGGRYIFLPKLAKHQRLEPDKTPSRLPGPDDGEPEPDPPSENFPDESAGGAGNSAQNRTVDNGLWDSDSDTAGEQRQPGIPNKSAQNPDESALARARSFKHVAGGMEHVAGIPPTAGALALVPSGPAPSLNTAQDLVGEWIEHCRKRPPGTVIGQVGKQIKAMLGEGIEPADIRAGLAEWWRKGVHPSVLPSIVNELMNATTFRAPSRPSTTNQRVAAAQALKEKFA